ncbi:MAG TPA: hypothetical protein VFS44_14315 [Gemmatimonadaceae bacterium]|nr:hypothetical protein [Gemmatimonadaceae bacterium]
MMWACGRDSAASEGSDRPPGCVVGALAPDVARTGSLDAGACAVRDGGRYADYSLHLDGGRPYLITATGRPDSASKRTRRYDVALLTSDAHPRELLAGSAFDGRAPERSQSQLFFVAPADGVYIVRVSGRKQEDGGPFALSVRACGGGTLAFRAARTGTLGKGSCLEQMRFGADSGFADLWRIHLAPRQKVRVRVRSAARVPPYVRIHGPGLHGDEADGDVGRLTFTARQGGNYTVLVGQTVFDSIPRAYTIRAEAPRY